MKTDIFSYRPWQGISVALILTIGLLSSCQKQQGIKPQRRDLTVGVYASGTVLPDHEYKVFSLAEGYLRKQLVAENDTFKAGAMLFELESTEQTSRRNLAEATRRLTDLNAGPNAPQLQELRFQLSTLRDKLSNDSLNLVRFKSLLQQQATTPAEVERRQLAYESTRNELNAAKQRLIRLERELQLQVRNATSNLEVSQTQQGYYTIKAPTNGRVYEVYKNPNELVRRGEAIALVGDVNRHYITLSVDEQDINRIKVGQTVVAEVDAYKGTFYKAHVTRIYPALNNQDQTYKLDADFDEPFPAAYVGMGVEANIIIAERKNALCIPAKYVMPGDTVYTILDGSDPTPRKLKRGEANFDWVEVLEGLPDGHEVVMPPKKK